MASAAEVCNRLVFESVNKAVNEAVNESSVYKFQLVERTYNQIQILTSLVECNENGETPLVIAMKGENVSLIDELVKFLRECDPKVAKWCHNKSLIAIDQLFHHQIPIIELILHLTKHLPDMNLRVIHSEWLDIIAQVVFNSTSLSRQDKITALELIGASLCIHYYEYEGNNQCFAVMFRCWWEAMNLRYFPADGEPLLLKTPDVSVPSVSSSVVFESAVEVMSMEELNLLQEYFERDVVDHDVVVRRRCIDLLRRQSLLVIRRISSQTNHGHPHWFYLKSLDPFNGKGNSVHSIVRCAENSRIVINSYLLILEQMTGFDPNLLSRQSFDVFIRALSIVSHYLAFMAMKPPGYLVREDLSYANLLTATKFIGTIAKCFPNPAMLSFFCTNSSYNGFAKIIFNLVFVLESMSPHLNNQQKQELEDYLSNFIRLLQSNCFLERTTSVLHIGVRAFLKRKFQSSKNLELIKLLIKLGANPNAIDKKGQTPLHILAGLKEFQLCENVALFQAFQALVDAGTHLGMAADDGDTVLWALRNLVYKSSNVAAIAYFSSLINTVFPLSWHCARAIRRHRIPSDGLPLSLQTSLTRTNRYPPTS